MAAEAYASYSSGRYSDALSHLSNLSITTRASGGDASSTEFRMQHNRALSEHGARGFSDPEALEATLCAIQSRLFRSSRSVSGEGGSGDTGSDANAEDSDETGAAGRRSNSRSNSSTSTSRALSDALLVGTSGGARAATAAVAGLVDLDIDASVLLYNLSALRFQQKQYGAAQAVLERLFLHIEPLDDSLAIHICLLLLDVLCHSARGNLHTEDTLRRFRAQTAAVLAFLERPHALNSSGGGGDSGGGGESGRQHHDDSGSGGSAEQTEFAFRLHLYKAKVLLLQEQTKSSKKEIKSALEIFQRELRGSGDGVSGAGAGGGGRQQQKGTFGPVPPPGVQNMAALYLKANLEHLRDNHRKALKLLASCHGFQGAEEYSGPGEAVGPPYFNNMGCLHHKLRRHHVALHYFQKALEALGKESQAEAAAAAAGEKDGSGEAAAAGRGGGKDGHVSPAPTCEVLYNTGLQLLLTEKPEQALRCFERAALLFHNRPYLWLRMAECCIVHHRLKATATANDNSSSEGDGGASSFTTATLSQPSSSGGDVGGDVGGGSDNPAAADAAAGGRGPLRWTFVGRGQHRRVLLPTGGSAEATGSGDCPGREESGDGAPADAAKDAAIVLEEDGGGNGGGGGGFESSNGSSSARKRGRTVAGRGGGCSLAYASRCLHNVLYLCSARAQGAKEAAASGAAGLLGGRPSVLGMSTRLVAKGLAANSSSNNSGGGGSGASTGESTTSVGGADGGGGGGAAAGDGPGVKGEELYQVALADLAFVHLGLDDPVSALAFAGRLIDTKPSPVNTYLAHLYAAEALCLLGRPAEALEHLAPITESDCTNAAAAAAAATSAATDVWSSPSAAAAAAAAAATATAGTSVPGQKTSAPAGGGGAVGGSGSGVGGGAGNAQVGGVLLSPKAADEARASLHANLAVVHAMQGALAQAERCARTAMGICPGSAAVLRATVYVFVRQGNVAEALQVLKEGRLSHN